MKYLSFFNRSVTHRGLGFLLGLVFFSVFFAWVSAMLKDAIAPGFNPYNWWLYQIFNLTPGLVMLGLYTWFVWHTAIEEDRKSRL